MSLHRRFAFATGALVAVSLPACGGANSGIPDARPDSGTREGTPTLEAGGDAATDPGGDDADDGTPETGAAPHDGGGGDAAVVATSCGSLPAEPTIPTACATLNATQAVASSALPSEANLDTVRIQTALNGCAAGQAVRLSASGTNNAFVSASLSLPSGVTLWVDAGATLYGSRSATSYGAQCGTTGGTCSALINVKGAKSGIVGKGIIDGQGGEPMMGQSQSWWQLTASTSGDSANPALIQALGATNFTMYEITLHNSPKFHVKLDANGFVVWGITIKTPSKSTNSQGTSLTPSAAHNTDGIDPGESASNGYIVYNDISDGDDQIAIKGGTSVHDLVIAHNHFLAGHGMSIGSETNGGVSNVNVCDLSIDGTTSGFGGGSSNGIRIKSYPGVGGPVTHVTYTDVCVRGLVNPILLTPFYATGTGSVPEYSGITIQDFHSVGTSPAAHVTIDGTDSSHVTGLTLDNVVLDGTPAVTAQFANVTLGPGNVSFVPSGNGVVVTKDISGASTPNACTGKWVSF